MENPSPKYWNQELVLAMASLAGLGGDFEGSANDSRSGFWSMKETKQRDDVLSTTSLRKVGTLRDAEGSRGDRLLGLLRFRGLSFGG